MSTVYNAQIVLEAQDRASQILQNVQWQLDSLGDKAWAISKSTWWAITDFAERNAKSFQTMAVAWWAMFTWLWIGIKRLLDNSVDLTESINAVEVVFGEASEAVLKYGETAATSAWLSQTSFNAMSTQVGALLKDTGISTQELSDKTIMLTERAADMASVFNTDVDDAMSAINQAIRGETEAIRRYAGDVTDATLQQYLLSQGIETSVTSMSQQEKRLLRIDVLMQQTNVTAWDFANTSDSLANKQRIIAAQAENVGNVIGKQLQPAIQSILSVVAPLLTKLFTWIEQNPKLATGIVVATAAVTWIIAALGILWLALPWIMTAVSALWVVIAALWWPITLAIAAVVALAWAYNTNMFGIRDLVQWVLENIKEFWGTHKDTIIGIATILGRVVLWVMTWGMSELTIMIGQNWDTITQKRSQAWEWIIAVSERLKNTLSSIWSVILGFIKDRVAGILEVINSLISWVQTQIDKLIGFFNKLWDIKKSVQGSVEGFLWIDWARATGWPVDSGKTYLVGEKWPELFVPNSWGSIIPNNKMGGWSTTQNTTINFWTVNVNDWSSRAEFVRLVEDTITNAQRNLSQNVY